MSRAGLPPELSQSFEEFMLQLGHADERSRTGLRRLLRKMLVAGLAGREAVNEVSGPG